MNYFVLFQLVVILIKLLPLRFREILIRQMFKKSKNLNLVLSIFIVDIFMYETNICHFLL